MIIYKTEKIPQGVRYEKTLELNNNTTFIIMKKDEACDLISGLAKLIYENEKNMVGACPDFIEGIYDSKRIVFAVHPEEMYYKFLYGLRDEEEKKHIFEKYNRLLYEKEVLKEQINKIWNEMTEEERLEYCINKVE